MSLIKLQLEAPRLNIRNPKGVRILATAPGRPCPICSTNLSQAMIDRISILCCPNCHGMAIPAQSLQAVIAQRAANPAQSTAPNSTPDLSEFVHCPACKGPMERHLYPGDPGDIVIDTCEHCLLNWLNCGELDRIANTAAFLSFAC